MELQCVSHLSSETWHNPILKLKLDENLGFTIPNTLFLEM